MHIALMEPKDPRGADLVAKLCAETGTSLHVIGPVEFSLDAIQEREEEGKLDFWMHPDWFEFRKAIARERCYYFAPDGGKEIEESRLRSTSVLMFAGPEGLPERIKEKYPHRIYRLPAGKPAEQVKAVLTAALQRVAGGAAPVERGEGAAAKPAPRRRRSRS